MHAFAGQGVEIAGQGGDQRLAFACFHFGDIALVQHHAAHQLHVEMALSQGALGRLAHHRKGFRQQVVQGLALLLPGAEGGRHGRQFAIRHGRKAAFQGIDLGNGAPKGFDLALIGGAEKRSGERTQHEILYIRPERGVPTSWTKQKSAAKSAWRPRGRHKNALVSCQTGDF